MDAMETPQGKQKQESATLIVMMKSLAKAVSYQLAELAGVMEMVAVLIQDVQIIHTVMTIILALIISVLQTIPANIQPSQKLLLVALIPLGIVMPGFAQRPTLFVRATVIAIMAILVITIPASQAMHI